MSISQHTAAVTCVKWGGEGLIYTASQDKTIKVWNSSVGALSTESYLCIVSFLIKYSYIGRARKDASGTRPLGKHMVHLY